MISQYIRIPFANSGDKEDIPQSVQVSGAISWPEGWGADYELDLEQDADAKPIDRLDMNQLFNVLSGAVKYLQENLSPEWITSAANGGTAFQYQTGQVVTYVDTSGTRGQWASISDNNTAEPGSDATKWIPFMFRPASASEVSAEDGQYPVLPAQVVSIIEANRETLPEASTSTYGIVQLSDALAGKSSTLAATEKAVGSKFNQLGGLGGNNIDDLTTATSAGIYFQSSDDVATTANGYPAGATAGMLIVYGNTNGWPAQTYFAHSVGRIWTRVRGTDSQWGSWILASPEISNATESVAGITKIGSDLNAKGSSRAFTEGGAANKLTFYRDALGATDLDSINDPTSQPGLYFQSVSDNATSSRHYPESIAGTLLATGNYNGALMQTYTTITGNVYSRYYVSNAGPYSSWTKINKSSAAGLIVFAAVAGNGAAPAGTLICNGAQISRSKYSELFAVIGTRFGEGDGSTTFNLPYMSPGYGIVSNLGLATNSLVTEGEVKSHTHTGTAAEAGRHYHYSENTAATTHGGNATGGFGVGAGHGAYAGEHTHTLTIDAEGAPGNFAAGYYGLPCITY